MSEKHSQEAIGSLDAEKVFKFVEFYENAGSTVKARTWTITTWILTINSALIAFCFELYRSNSNIVGFLYVQFAVCAVGVALCLFLFFLIQDQGRHLQRYWTQVNKIGAWNRNIRDLVLRDELENVLQPDYRASFPRFCKRLRTLCGIFAAGFIGTFLLMFYLNLASAKIPIE